MNHKAQLADIEQSDREFIARSQIQSSEFYTLEIDPAEKRDVMREISVADYIFNAPVGYFGKSDNPISRTVAIDAGYMRLAHAVVHPDSFEAIPRVFIPRFKRANGGAIFTFIFALAIASLGALAGMVIALYL